MTSTEIYLTGIELAVAQGNAVSADGIIYSVASGMLKTQSVLSLVSAARRRVIVIGNGGSAAIASHVAVDLNTAGVRALALNDGPALTCVANDFGYENVFVRQIEWTMGHRDALIAISSSGRSPNILEAVKTARRRFGALVVTFSGFGADNPLRGLGDLNIWVNSTVYGIVEMAHQIMLHAIADSMAEIRKKDAADK